MSVPLLDLARQYRGIAPEIDARMRDVIERQAFILGSAVEAFEKDFAAYVGAEHAIGVASGTDALLLALKTLDLEPEDEVIAPTFTFFATAGAIHNSGGRAVFVDVVPDTFNIDVEAVEAAITDLTRAIVPVHLFGQMADTEPLRRIAQERGLLLLEDSAQAVGARQRINGEMVATGVAGDAAAFSFFPSKNLGGFGDGGMITTDDPELADRLRRLRVHGGHKMYHHEEVGTNSRLDALQAAVLHAKLPYLEQWTEARADNAAWYQERLAPLENKGVIGLPVIRPENRSVFNQYTIRAQDRDALREHLNEREIGNSVYYPTPLHLQPCFEHLGGRPGDHPVSEKAAEEVVSIPIFPELTEAELEEVAGAIEEFYA